MLSLATVTFAFMSLALFQLPTSAAFAQDQDDTFFSGTLDEFTHESATVTREVLGNAPERRTFVITAQTKIEGKLADGARVTVKFRQADDTMIAETIIVREPLKPKKK